jgi:chromosome segregation ATPase
MLYFDALLQLVAVENLEEETDRLKRDCQEKAEKISSVNKQLSSMRTELQRTQNNHRDLVAQCSTAEDALKKEKENAARLANMLRYLSFILLNVIDHVVYLRAKEDEVRGKTAEIRELEAELLQRQKDVEQRVSQVDVITAVESFMVETNFLILQMAQLEMLMSEHSSGTEQRLVCLEAALKKSQVEAMQRTSQVSNLDEQLQDFREQLREKDLQLQHFSQLQQKSKGDLSKSEEDRHNLEDVGCVS